MAVQVGHHFGLFGRSCFRLFLVGREDPWGADGDPTISQVVNDFRHARLL